MVNREQKQIVSYNDKMLQMKKLRYYKVVNIQKFCDLI